MGEEGMSLQGFDDRCDSIVSTDAQVVTLGDVVSQNDARALANSRENSQENPSLQRLGLIHDHKAVME
jgi:hypothetical protein